jgi:molybdopterin molybdotransferase
VLAFDEALSRVLGAVTPFESEPVPLAGAAGRVLREPVDADIDVPPFDTTAMDGWAVRAAEAAAAPLRLRVAGPTVGAGGRGGALPAGAALKVMTGAPMPDGSDAIVPVEQAEEEREAVLLRTAPAEGAHVRRRGEVIARGDRLLASGRRLSPADIVLLAAAGRASVRTARRARTAVLVTGDEVVATEATPGPAQIRNTNGPLLVASLTRLGADVTDLGVSRDERDALSAALGRALAGGFDVVLTTGGVSAGDFDLVPALLETLGVTAHFHKVAIRPAKPVFFGTKGPTLVFGLPGNPVSAAVALDLFVRPALRKSSGLLPPLPPTEVARLTAPARNKGSRLAFVPATLAREGGRLTATPIRAKGSHDVLAHARANGLLVLPGGSALAAGDRADVHVGTDETTLGRFE